MNEIIGRQCMAYVVLMAKLLKIYEQHEDRGGGGFLSRNLFAPQNNITLTPIYFTIYESQSHINKAKFDTKNTRISSYERERT